MSTMCQGFSRFKDPLHHFVFGRLATTSIPVNMMASSLAEQSRVFSATSD